MANDPTPVRSYRLSDDTVNKLRRAAETMQVSTAKLISNFAAALSADVDPHGAVPLEGYAAAESGWAAASPRATDSMACPLGYGHTAHVWELTGKPHVATGIYNCAGQPFSIGFDPIDDPMGPIREAVDAAAPHIAERERLRTYRNVTTRLEGFADMVDPAIVQHFRSLAGPESEWV